MHVCYVLVWCITVWRSIGVHKAWQVSTLYRSVLTSARNDAWKEKNMEEKREKKNNNKEYDE